MILRQLINMNQGMGEVEVEEEVGEVEVECEEDSIQSSRSQQALI